MKTLKIKGERMGVVVDDLTGNKLKEFKKQNKSGWVDLEGWSGNIDDIKSIVEGIDEENRERSRAEERDFKKEENNKYYEDLTKEYFNEMVKIKKGSKENKIKYNMNLANFTSYASTGLWLIPLVGGESCLVGGANNSDIKFKIKELIEKAIDDGDITVNPKKYSYLFKAKDFNQKLDYNLEDYARVSALKFIENKILNDASVFNSIK